jgi:hypothetical protein
MVGALSSFKQTPASRPQAAPAAAAPEAPTSPLDSLPDLSTIEARAQENAPGPDAPESNTGISTTQKTILAAAGLATVGVGLLAPSAAHAGGRRHGYGHNYPSQHHHHRHRDRDKTGAIIGGIIGGIILGEIIRESQIPPHPMPPHFPEHPQQVQRPFYDNYGRLICPNGNGGWYMSVDRYQCRAW